MKKTIGIGTLIAFYILIVWTFLTAYFHPSKQVLISVNNYGEAHIEFILILFTLPFVIFCVYDYMKK